MRYFDTDNKFNWVDENNVYLGYDSSQQCCEDADWFVCDEITKDIGYNSPSGCENDLDWENWEFDTQFFDSGYGGGGDGGVAIFRLNHKEENRYTYLHLFNCHNGYYGHGFVFKIGDEVKMEDYL